MSELDLVKVIYKDYENKQYKIKTDKSLKEELLGEIALSIEDKDYRYLKRLLLQYFTRA